MGYNVHRALCYSQHQDGPVRLTRRPAQGRTAGKPHGWGLNRGLAVCPRPCCPGAHLFFSSELKSRVPVSSWLSLWRGTPSKAAVNWNGLGDGGGGGRY